MAADGQWFPPLTFQMVVTLYFFFDIFIQVSWKEAKSHSATNSQESILK